MTLLFFSSQTRGKERNVGRSDSRCRPDLNKSTHCRGWYFGLFTQSLPVGELPEGRRAPGGNVIIEMVVIPEPKVLRSK